MATRKRSRSKKKSETRRRSRASSAATKAASKPRVRKLSAPPSAKRWYRETGKQTKEFVALTRELDTAQGDRYGKVYDERAEYLQKKRAERLQYLRVNAKSVRQYFKGFEAADGFDLHHPEQWTAAQVRKLTNRARILNEILAGPHQRIVPKTKREKAALKHHTRLVAKDVKAFPVTMPSRDSKVHVTKKGRVSVRRPVKGGYLQDQFFYFADYKPPSHLVTFQDLRDALKLMLPDLPDSGNYVFNSAIHGPIGNSQPKESLDYILRQWWEAYDKNDLTGEKEGFPSGIVGVIRLSNKIDPDEEYAERRKRRARDAKERNRERQRLFGALKADPRRCPKCGAYVKEYRKRCPKGHLQK